MINEKPKIISATSQACTYNTTYFNTPEKNTCEKYGQVVHIVFYAELKAVIPNNTNILSGLPKLVNNFRIPYMFASDKFIADGAYKYGGNFQLSTDGTSSRLTSYEIPSSYVRKFIYLNFTYMSED